MRTFTGTLDPRFRRRGFTIIQTTIGALIMSSLAVGMVSYMKRSNMNLRQTDLSEEITQSGQFITSIFEQDLSQVAFVNPLHSTNNPLTVTSVTTAASAIVIRGGITPLPGMTKESIHSLTSFALPANIGSSQASLTESNDGVRLVMYDFSSALNCRLSPWHGTNPSTSAESLWVDATNCTGITAGKLYLITQSWTGGTYGHSNVFQVTGVGTAASAPNKSTYNEIQLDHSSTSNRYNQTGGLGNSGYTSEARIFPIKLVEWGVSSSGGLYRREITPSAGDLVGLQSWVSMQKDVEGIQFYAVTGTTSGAVEHTRTMQFTTATTNNGIEDIRGISPRISIKSRRPSSDPSKSYHNALLTTYTSDSFPRLELKFFVAMRNLGD